MREVKRSIDCEGFVDERKTVRDIVDKIAFEAKNFYDWSPNSTNLSYVRKLQVKVTISVREVPQK